MNKLQASIRDRAAATWRERKVMYKVGSPMKGCKFCGDVEEDEESGKRRYLSGFNVFRAYKPWETGWTWKCWECGSKDLACWETDAAGMVEYELGREPIAGNRDVVRETKYRIRKSLMAQQDKPDVQPRSQAKVDRIAQLEAQLALLTKMIKGGKNASA